MTPGPADPPNTRITYEHSADLAFVGRVFIVVAIGALIAAIWALSDILLLLFGPLGLLLGFPLAIVFDVAVRRLYVRDTLGKRVEIMGKPAKPS